MNGQSLHRLSIAVLSVTTGVIGLVLLVQALTAPTVSVVRLLLGALFLAAGCGRLYLTTRRGHDA